jgi:hypothetical protein
LGWIDSLPSGPEWQSTTLEFLNYTTERPIELIWRDGLAVTKDLFANPIFANHMIYDPHVVMTGSEREYSEFFTGERAFFIQVRLFVSNDGDRLLIPSYNRTNFQRARPWYQSFLHLTRHL